MNKQWVEDSHLNAEYCRGDVDNYLEWFEYLDVVGLFETSWMIYEYHKSISDYEYPRKN